MSPALAGEFFTTRATWEAPVQGGQWKPQPCSTWERCSYPFFHLQWPLPARHQSRTYSVSTLPDLLQHLFILELRLLQNQIPQTWPLFLYRDLWLILTKVIVYEKEGKSFKSLEPFQNSKAKVSLSLGAEVGWKEGGGAGGCGMGKHGFQAGFAPCGPAKDRGRTSVRRPKTINGTKLLGGNPSKSFISKILKKLGVFFGKSWVGFGTL